MFFFVSFKRPLTILKQQLQSEIIKFPYQCIVNQESRLFIPHFFYLTKPRLKEVKTNSIITSLLVQKRFVVR